MIITSEALVILQEIVSDSGRDAVTLRDGELLYVTRYELTTTATIQSSCYFLTYSDHKIGQFNLEQSEVGL